MSRTRWVVNQEIYAVTLFGKVLTFNVTKARLLASRKLLCHVPIQELHLLHIREVPKGLEPPDPSKPVIVCRVRYEDSTHAYAIDVPIDGGQHLKAAKAAKQTHINVVHLSGRAVTQIILGALETFSLPKTPSTKRKPKRKEFLN